MKKNHCALSIKHYALHWLMAAMIGGLSLTFTACSDDDDNKSEQTRGDADPLDTDEARTAFRWLCVLADASTLDDNWKSKTYEPTIGQASENSQYTRIVVVNDLGEAKVKFSKIADLDVDQLGTKQVVDGGAAGTMTWEPSKADAENLAVVTVNSRIMPHLQKIVYCTEAQVGSNGYLWDSMKGTAYYRLGDVVMDKDGYYWVCVRPALAPDKTESHWINIFNASKSGDGKGIPNENVITKWNNLDKYNYQTIKLPTKLAFDREHLHNLANLVWALIRPGTYQDACLNNNSIGLCGFQYTYHGEKFLNAVAQNWDKLIDGHTIWEKLFNHPYREMKDLSEMHLFYQGYSWKVGKTGYLWRYSTTGYEPNYYGSDSDDKELFKFVEEGIDITYYAYTENAVGKPLSRFTNAAEGKHTGSWVVRYKKGSKLGTGSYSPYNRLGDCTDIYCYNAVKGIKPGKDTKPETEDNMQNHSAKEPKLHYLLAKNGYYYETKADCEIDNTEPVAIVVGEKRDWGTLEQGHDEYNYLLMALKIVDEDLDVPFGPDFNCCTQTQVDKYLGINDGLAMTQTLKNGCGRQHEHKPAEFAWNATLGISDSRRQALNLSNGFLPSAGQIAIMLNHLWTDQVSFYGPDDEEGWFGGDPRYAFDNFLRTLTNLDGKTNGLTEDDFTPSVILSSTEYDNRSQVVLYFEDNYSGTGYLTWGQKKKNIKMNPVLPFFLAK